MPPLPIEGRQHVAKGQDRNEGRLDEEEQGY